MHGKLGGSITTYNGNTTGTELGGAALIGYRQGRNLVYLNTSANYWKMGGDVRVANACLPVPEPLKRADLMVRNLLGLTF